MLWLESGEIQISARSSPVRVEAASGLFSADSWPFAMELSGAKGTLSVAVTAGSVRTQNLDSSAVTFRAAGGSPYRTLSTGADRPPEVSPVEAPPLFIQPIITLGGATTNPQATPATPKTWPPKP